MIRIKCPKCATPLTVDDAKAGKPEECTECGARFRVPVPKATVPARAPKAEEEKRRPVRRRDEEEDEDDEELDDELDDEPRPRRPRRKSKGLSESAKMNIRMAIALLLFVIALGVGGCFINRLGLLVFWISIFVTWGCGFMIARMAWQDS